MISLKKCSTISQFGAATEKLAAHSNRTVTSRHQRRAPSWSTSSKWSSDTFQRYCFGKIEKLEKGKRLPSDKKTKTKGRTVYSCEPYPFWVHASSSMFLRGYRTCSLATSSSGYLDLGSHHENILCLWFDLLRCHHLWDCRVQIEKFAFSVTDYCNILSCLPAFQTFTWTVIVYAVV